jgi:mannose-1-phosphate guanylyltransferase
MRRGLVLAAGLGERLRPLTLKIPKCLLPINGWPLIDIWLDICRGGGIDEVLVNTHHLAAQVHKHMVPWKWRPAVRMEHEEHLLGSAGTLAHNRGFFQDHGPFAIIYADTLIPRLDIDAMFRCHHESGALLTMGLFRTPYPSECGIVEMNEAGRIVSFEEKPAEPASDLANAGVHIADPEILDLLPRRVPSDLGHDVLPLLAGEMFGFVLEGPVIDIGTPARYRAAQEAGRKMGMLAYPGPGEARKKSPFLRGAIA